VYIIITVSHVQSKLTVDYHKHVIIVRIAYTLYKMIKIYLDCATNFGISLTLTIMK